MAIRFSKIKPGARPTVASAALAIFAIAVFVVVYFARINRNLDLERDRASEAARVEVRESQLRAPSTDGVAAFLNAARARATAVYSGTRYLATSGGLVALDGDGNVKRRYTTLDGLPDNDLTALAVFRDRLFIGTATAGLLAFDQTDFYHYSFIKPKASRVSVLVATDQELLIGTLDQGLFEFDGERFSKRINSATGAEFKRVTALLPFESRLYIGTQDQGLFIWREGRIDRVATTEGLPSPHVTGLTALPGKLAASGSVAVATDFGIVGLTDANELRPISALPNITSIALSGGRLVAGLFSGGVVSIDLGSDDKKHERATSEATALPRSAPATVVTGEGYLWALTTEGAFRRADGADEQRFDAVAAALVGERILTGDHITGLDFDGANRLWVGYFDNGVDIIDTEFGERVSHIEDDRVREVNFVRHDTSEGRMLVATSRGLVDFDGSQKQTVLTREKDGIVSDAVAHVSFMDSAQDGATLIASRAGAGATRAMVLATGGGLTHVAGGRARSLTAFHGLASNYLYTSAPVGSRLFVGSSAGLVELEGLRVLRTYKTANSPLSHDWVSALAEADGTLYVGTNGGGVDALLSTGEWVNFSDELGKFEVNQNALRHDGERLYVGTTDRGLLVYELKARRWNKFSAGLASQNVTAIATDDRFVYIGTLNGLTRIEKRIL